MNVLSLFDGMSCGMIALERAGIDVNKYYAAEIDKHSQIVSADNYPNIIRLGDITKWKEWDIDWLSIDLLIGGSPCQGFSFAGKELAFDDPRSALFFVYVDILNHIKSVNPNVKFLLENVRMKKESLSVISDYLGVNPVVINSNLVSAQNRVRYYWANWEFGQPEDKDIVLADILETDIDSKCGRIVGRKINPDTGKRDDYNDNIKAIQRFESRLDDKSGTLTTVQKDNVLPTEDRSNKLVFLHGLEKGRRLDDGKSLSRNFREGSRIYPVSGKSATLTAQPKGGEGGHSGLYGCLRIKRVNDNNRAKVITENERGYRPHKGDIKSTGISELGRIMKPNSKTDTLTTSHAPKLALNDDIDDLYYRKLTPVECERLQTVPDNFSAMSLNTHYQHDIMLGNECNEAKLWKSVDSKNVISQSQVGKLNCAISTILGGLEMEQQILLGVSSIRIKIAHQKGVSENRKHLKVFVLNTINNGNVSSLPTNRKSVKYAINLSDKDRKDVVQGITTSFSGTETHYTLKNESSRLMGTKDVNTLKQVMVDGYIELLLKKLSVETCEKEKLSIILTVISTIIAKAIFLCAKQIPVTLQFTGNLKPLQESLLEMDLSFLKTESISETSNTARYKMLGNGWTIDVIAHIFRSME